MIRHGFNCGNFCIVIDIEIYAKGFPGLKLFLCRIHVDPLFGFEVKEIQTNTLY